MVNLKKKEYFGDNNINTLLSLVYKRMSPSSAYLDLGCGSGENARFMANNGFQVMAIDRSVEAVSRLGNVKNIEALCHNIQNYKIDKNKYQAISIFYVLHFLKKREAYKVIESVKENLSENGFAIISAFTTNDSLHKNGANKDMAYFAPNELKELFADWQIEYYEEAEIEDEGHPGFEKPHQHHLANLIAKKLS